MLGTSETVRRDLPPSPPLSRHQNHQRKDDAGGEQPKLHTLAYRRRKASGLCTSSGCHARVELSNSRCRKHLEEMSRRNKEQYQQRMRRGLCIYCGERPPFWGVRCVICRQRFSKHPLPYGARRALRLYREAERKRQQEQVEVEARHAARKLLAGGELNGKRAKALRLYAGVDDGEWRTYKEVGMTMHISKERVRQL